jgi:dinuclear metal center YbgI/SA1388 family protein
LLTGDPRQGIKRALLCIDLVPEVLEEAQNRRVELVLAYHPPIFEGLKKIRADREPVIYEAVRSRTAIYAIHTALDVLPGGTSDVLADLVDLVNRSPVEMAGSSSTKQSKLVVFVPYEAKQLQNVSLAIFKAGGGHIGEYSCCSFLSAGHGTFLGGPHTHPAIGQHGKLETVEEIRMEVVVDNAKLSEVVQAMKAAHPYEEPAYDIIPLAGVGEELGIGRVGDLPARTNLKSVVAAIKRRTGLKNVQVVDAGRSTLSRVAVGPGSCGKMLDRLAGQIDLFITGEIRHHTALAARQAGTSVICLGHGNSERIALAGLKKMIAGPLEGLEVMISKSDADPLTIL